jgi:DNA-binding transcriptional LysR family regulator
MTRIREEAHRNLADLHHLKRGVLRLIANESVGFYLLPALLKAYRRLYPSVKIEVSQSRSQRIPGLILDQDIDFGFLSFAPSHKDLGTRRLFRDELALALPPDHPLALKGPLDLRQLGAEPFIGHMAQTPNRIQLNDLFEREQVPLNFVMELSSLETIKDFVRAREGLAILPRLCLEKELAAGTLVSPPVRGMVIGRDVRLVFRESRTHSPAGAAFLDLVNQAYPE